MEKINLFDLIKVLFTDKQKWKKLTDYQKRNNHFIVNRRMSIKYPDLANYMNKYGLDGARVLDMWQIMFNGKFFKRGKGGRKYPIVPQFIYTKSKSKKEPKQKKSWEPDKDLVKRFCIKYGISQKQYEDSLRFNKEKIYKKIQKFDKITKVIEK